MAKKNWIHLCQRENKDITNTEQIAWESSSSEDESSVSFWKNGNNVSVESPIIRLRCFDVNRISPELSQRNTFIYDKIPSPVIGKRRLRIKKCRKIKEYNKSPEVFCLEPTQHIEHESPTFDDLNSQVATKIEPFQSQFGSSVEDNNPYNCLLYYQPPKRKKTYKKGGLAHQLQNVLKLRTARIKIWHHEKLKNIDDPLDNRKEITQFRIKHSWTEYGVTLLECYLVKNFFSGDNDALDILLINLGVGQVLNIEFVENAAYELYPPYSTDTVMYKDTIVSYYFNISKIMKIST